MRNKILLSIGLAALARPARAADVKESPFEIRVQGYQESCFDGLALYRWENGAWRRANRSLPGKGLYYLDGTFVSYGACDYVVCKKLEGPLRVKFFEYRRTGDRPPPAGSGTTAPTLPVFETAPLKGRIKVELTYFTDDKCGAKKTFSKVLRR